MTDPTDIVERLESDASLDPEVMVPVWDLWYLRFAAAEIVALRAENEQLQADNVRMANVLAHPIMQACLGLNPQITSGDLSTNPTNQGAK